MLVETDILLLLACAACIVQMIPGCYLQSILGAAIADMEAARQRDPACDKYTQCILHFKGFQAVQCHRISHWLWQKGRKVTDMLYTHQSPEAKAFLLQMPDALQ